MEWRSSVGCDSFRDETYRDVKTSGNNWVETYRAVMYGTYHPCTFLHTSKIGNI
jgi:hypothetical protein